MSRAGSVASALCVVMLVTGCGKDDRGGSAAAGRYGYGPQPDKSVVYQPDVVLVGGGSATIRSVSRDGFTYVIDAHARGSGEVRPGKIMFVTSEAVGRVVKVEPSGDDIAVTLAPVKVTDVVRDGHFTVDQPLALESQTFSPLPDLLGEIVEDGSGLAVDTTGAAEAPGTTGSVPQGAMTAEMKIVVPALRLAAVRARALEQPSNYSAKVGDWSVQAYKSATRLGLTAEHSTAVAGLKANFDIHLKVQNPRVRGEVRVTHGVIPHAKFRIDGIKSLAVTIAAGAQGGLSDNKKAKIEFPIEIKTPILIGGFPATLKDTFKFLVSTAFSAKNGNVSASGEWALDGPIGYDGSAVLTPSFSVMKSLVQSISGVSVGVEGIVVAVEFRFGLMIGLPVAGAGPSMGIVASIGLTNGSSAGRIGLPLAGPQVQCRGATLVLSVRAGEGINLSAPLSQAIKHVLNVDIPAEVDLVKQDIVNRTVVEPDVPLCRN